MTGARLDHPPDDENRSAPEVRSPEREPADSSRAPNVVPFRRPSHGAPARDAPVIAIHPNDRPAIPAVRADSRAKAIAILTGSLLVHAALYAAADREPAPMASIGLETMSVEIVLGDNVAPGAQAPAAETDSPEQHQHAEVKSAEVKREEPTRVEQTPIEKPPVDVAEVLPEQKVPDEVPPLETTAALAAPVASAEIAEAVAPRENEPEVAAPPPTTAAPQPRSAAPRKSTPPKPPREHHAARTSAGATVTGANGVSAGSSSANGNYQGLVAAHLARHKRFPAEARSRGEGGRPVVTFVLDGGGRVTRVALVRASGVASLDQEVQSMVQRASPFPAPPDGRPASFTVPVSFKVE